MRFTRQQNLTIKFTDVDCAIQAVAEGGEFMNRERYYEAITKLKPDVTRTQLEMLSDEGLQKFYLLTKNELDQMVSEAFADAGLAL